MQVGCEGPNDGWPIDDALEKRRSLLSLFVLYKNSEFFFFYYTNVWNFVRILSILSSESDLIGVYRCFSREAGKMGLFMLQWKEYKNGENVSIENYKPDCGGSSYDLTVADLKNRVLRRSLWIWYLDAWNNPMEPCDAPVVAWPSVMEGFGLSGVRLIVPNHRALLRNSDIDHEAGSLQALYFWDWSCAQTFPLRKWSGHGLGINWWRISGLPIVQAFVRFWSSSLVEHDSIKTQINWAWNCVMGANVLKIWSDWNKKGI